MIRQIQFQCTLCAFFTLSVGCVSAVDGEGETPPIPSNLAAIAGNGSITLTWNDVPGVSEYILHWGLTEEMGKDSGKIRDVESPYMDTDVTNGVRFYYAVSSFEGGLESARSEVVSALPDLGATTPGAPSQVSAESTNAGIQVEWMNVPGALYYSIYKDRDSGVTPETGTPVVGVENPFVDTEADDGETWYYVVTSTTENGESPYSAQVDATMAGGAVGVPDAPSGLSATAGNAEVALSWSPAAGATSYNLYFDTTSGRGTSGTVLSGVSSPYTHTGLTNSTSYFYVVTAVNGSGESDPSIEVSAVPQDGTDGPPLTPQNVTATPGDGHVVLSWTDSPGADGYSIYVNTSPGGISELSATSSPFVHSGLVNGQAYTYAMLAYNQEGQSSLTEEVSATPSEDLAPLPTRGSISATLPAGIHGVVIFENFDDGGGIFQVQVINGDAINGTPIDGLSASISGEAEGGLTAVGGGTGTYQGVVPTPFSTGAYTVSISGAVSGTLSMQVNDIPSCLLSSPTTGQVFPTNTDLPVTWTSNNSDKALIQLEDSQGLVQYPALTPDPQGAILPGADIPYAGALEIMVKATWQAETEQENADLIFFGDCAVQVNLQ